MPFEFIGFLYIFPGNSQMRAAFFLVMPFPGNRVCRAAVNAFTAGAVGIMEAVGMVVCIGAWRGLQGYFCDHGANAHRFSPGGNETVTQAKGTQSCRMGSMAF